MSSGESSIGLRCVVYATGEERERLGGVGNGTCGLEGVRGVGGEMEAMGWKDEDGQGGWGA